MSPQLNVKNLVVDLQTEAGMARAVDALHISLNKGQTFALVGESGCGKSMTALSLLRLLPDNAVIQSGKVELAEMDVFKLSESQMRTIRGRRISIIFQEPSTSLNPVMTVGDQILEVIFQHTSLQGQAARQRAIEWFTKVGLPEPERRMGSYPFEMSGGQLQRVMIAIALAAEPDLLIRCSCRRGRSVNRRRAGAPTCAPSIRRPRLARRRLFSIINIKPAGRR